MNFFFGCASRSMDRVLMIFNNLCPFTIESSSLVREYTVMSLAISSEMSTLQGHGFSEHDGL